MAKKILHTSNELQFTNKVDGPMALDESNNILEERIDTSENQENNGNTKNSDHGNLAESDGISLNIKEEVVQAFQSAQKPAKNTEPSPLVITPKRRDLSHIGIMEAAFENGYDNDGQN